MKRALLFLLIFIPFWVNGQGFARKFYDKNFKYTQLDDDENLFGPGFSPLEYLTKFYKFNKAGDTIYTKKYPESLSSARIFKILPLHDKTYLFLTGDKIIKTDTLAGILWERSIIRKTYNQQTEFEDASGNLLFSGHDHYNYLGYVSKYNSNGDSLWSKAYPLQILNISSTEFGYILLGTEKNSANLLLAGITNEGDTLWTKKFPNIYSFTYGSSKEGKIIVISKDLKLYTINSNGDTLFSKKITLYGSTNKISVSEDAFFITNFVSGEGTPYDILNFNISKVDFSGNTLWTSNFSTGEIFHLTPLSDGGFLATCSTYTYPLHTLIVRADKNGKIYPNYIKGKIINDINNNCMQDAGEAGMAGVKLRIEPDNNFVFTNNQGEYSYPADTGVSYKITPLLAIDQTSECYPFRTVSFGNKEIDSLDNNFYIKADLCPKLYLNANISLNKVRCFTGASTITCNNFGTIQAENVEISIDVPSTYIIKNASVPFSLSGNKYSFKPSDIDPNKELKISITDSMSCNAQLGESAYIRSTVSTSTTCLKPQLVHDTVITKILVVGSFDPNDKQVFPSKINFDDYVNNKKKLKYMIRFQNTGNWQANFIRVIDTLPPSLDLNSIQDIKISHPYSMELIKTNPTIIEWFFENINLPAQSQSEELSQGYISFTIDLKEGLQDKTSVSNGAAIYFDYNEPVITNRATTLISSEEETETYKESITTGTQKVSSSHSIILFPNPITESSVIRIVPALNTFKTAVYDSKGIKLFEKDGSGDEVSIHRNELKPGIYFYHLYTENQEIGKGSFLVK